MKRLAWLLVLSVVLTVPASAGGSLPDDTGEDVFGLPFASSDPFTLQDPGDNPAVDSPSGTTESASTFASDVSRLDFWVDARDGWWSDVLILSDGSGPSDVLRALSPDALNWAFYELPSYLADIGTRCVASTELGYQESPELEPEDLADWEFASSLAFDVFDRPIRYTQWGGSYFMDPHSDAWAGAVLEGIRDALADADGVSQDNIGVPPFIKGAGGFSTREKTEFRTFLLDRLGTAELASRSIDTASFDIAAYIREHDYLNGNPQALADPVFRAFVAYQYVSNLRIWQGMLDDIGIATQDEKITHGNQYGFWSRWDSNPYAVLLSQLHQIVEIEYVSTLDSMPPDAHDSLIYKLGLASGRMQKPVWVRGIVYDWERGRSVLRPWHLRLIAASAYANGAVRTFEYGQGTPNGQVDLSEEAAASLLDYYDWLDDVRFLFERRQPVANVAVVYSIPTMMWRFFPATGHWNSDQVASLSGIAEVLEREHVPYDVLIFGHPDVWSDEGLADRLANYDLLILPDVDCLSEDQIATLEAFVARGGRLLYTGALGRSDEDLMQRGPSQMAGLLDHPNVFGLSGTPGRDFYREAVIDRRNSNREREAIAAQVAELLGDDLALEASAPDTVSINAYTTGGGLYCVHFLNLDYDVEDDTIAPTGPFDVRLRLPADAAAQDHAVTVFGDDGTSRAILAERDGSWLSVTMPGVETHAVLAVGDLADAAIGAVAACEAALERNPWAIGRSDIATQVGQMNDSLDAGNWLAALDICATLEDRITSSSPNVLFDFSHLQDAALTEDDARTINPDHPEWFILEELASHVTRQVDVRPISDDALRDVDVLAIAVYRAPFSQDEIDAVERFVRAGGGLLLIGNGGASSAPGSLTARLGIQFLPYSALAAEDHLWDLVSFDTFDIAEHPITTGVERLQLNYAAPMTVSTDWTIIASTAPEVWQERGGDERRSPGELGGPFPVVAFRSYGEGQIAAVCDDAPFRDWGSPSLVYNLIRWLAGK